MVVPLLAAVAAKHWNNFSNEIDTIASTATDVCRKCGLPGLAKSFIDLDLFVVCCVFGFKSPREVRFVRVDQRDL